MTQPRDQTPSVRRLSEGEPLYTWAAVALCAAVLMTLGAAGSVFIPVRQSAQINSARRDLESTGRLLAHVAGPLLAEGRTGDVRLLLTTAAQEAGLSRCRIVAADGSTIAQSLAGGAVDGEGSPWDVAVSTPLALAGSGEARLELGGAAALSRWYRLEGQIGMGVLAAAGLVGLAFAATRLRARARALNAVGDALVSMARGEQTASALSVDGRFGAEAAAWNHMLEERERLRQELMSERAKDSLLSRGDGRGDLGQACDALWQGMVLVDEHLHVKYANGAAAVFLRVKKDLLCSSSAVTDFVTDERVIDAVRAVARGELRRRSTYELRRPESDGGGILRFNIRPVRRDDAAAALIIIEDITQQRVADEARNAFVAQVTHELRTPLTNIRLYVEQAIEQGESDPAVVAQSLNIINQESRRLERIVGDMLSVSEIEAGSFKLRTGEVRLDTVFEELQADYKPQAQTKDITLTFHLPPKLPVIKGDRDKIVLALHNLIGNAIKYTPVGGKVDVRVEADDSPDGQLTVEVVDTGIGISPEETELIFDKFYRSRDKRVSTITGTGLGLALAREVVRLHGGDISVRSQVDRGSTFRLSMPTLARAA